MEVGRARLVLLRRKGEAALTASAQPRGAAVNNPRGRLDPFNLWTSSARSLRYRDPRPFRMVPGKTLAE
jgi:hypothetical protein